MAIYKVEAPDGSILRIEGPDDASQEDVLRAAREQYAPREESKQAPKFTPNPVAWEKFRQDLRESGVSPQDQQRAIDTAMARRIESPVWTGTKASSSVSVAEPSAADLLRQKMAALEKSIPPITQGPVPPEAVQAAQLGASGLAAMGGYKASPVLGGMMQRVAEASQRPAFSAPGTAPVAPPATPAGGLIPTDPQNVRIQTGTTVDDTTGRARQTGYTERTAQEAARRQELARIQQELVAKRIIPPGSPMAQMPGMTSTPGGVLVPSGAVYPTTPSAPPAPKVSPLTQVSETFKTIGRTGANLFADLMRSRAMGALGAGSAAYQGLEALKHLRAGRDEEAALSGLGALGGGLMVIPSVPTGVVGGALSAAPYLYRKYREATPEQTQRMLTNVGPSGEPTP